MDTLPKDLSAYNITINNNQDTIICELEYKSKIFYSEIYPTDLKSGMVSLIKLANIIKSNSKQIHPNFTIWMDLIQNDKTNINYLVLNINFCSEFIEFDEKIYFREKRLLLNEKEFNTKLEQVVKSQNDKIIQLENNISQMSDIIKRLENKLDKIETEQHYYYDVFHYVNNNRININPYIPKNIDEIIIDVVDLNISRIYISYHDFLQKEIKNIQITNLNILHYFRTKKILLLDTPKIDDSSLKTFFDTYLKDKNDFNIDEIKTNNYGLINILIKYTNYNKLIIKYYNNYDYKAIKTHCETNNIEFEYY